MQDEPEDLRLTIDDLRLEDKEARAFSIANRKSQIANSPRSFIFHAKLISALTLLSRILGLARESAAALYFGAGPVWSAFVVAFTIPNLFRKLFGEGALSAAFIPLYSQAIKADEDEANRFAAAGVTLLTAILIGVTILGEIILWLITQIWDIRPDQLLMVKLTAIMLPYVVLICGTAFLSGILQVHRRFGLPAAAPVLLNVIHIIVILMGARILHLGGKSDPGLIAERQITLVYWLAFFVLVAGVLQVMMLLPALRHVGFRFLWIAHFRTPLSHLWTPMVRRMLSLSVPVALGAGVLQLSVLLDKGLSFFLAQGLDEAGRLVTHFNVFGYSLRYPLEIGAAARLNWAQYLYQFPLGIFAIALATAIFPSLSSDALDADPDKSKFRNVLQKGIETTLFEGIAASVGLIIVAYPAIRLLLEHGEFTSEDTRWVARSVTFYSAAIWAFSLQQIINRAYYALHDTRTPLVMSIVTLAVNLAVEIPLLWTPLGEAGMAAGTCVSFSLQAVVMLWMLNRRVGGLGLERITMQAGKMLFATAIMVLACWGVRQLPFYPQGAGKFASFLQLIILMATGATVYLAVCAAMGISIMRHILPKRKK